MQVPQVTEEVAMAVLDLFPTLFSLARAYSLLVSPFFFLPNRKSIVYKWQFDSDWILAKTCVSMGLDTIVHTALYPHNVTFYN